ncbi:hypothetical protein ACH2GS_001541 [Acinetobacter baumannii]|nr:hypothetical protein [Acinetobacter baumannii]EKW1221097.1 hypothetical protein [Acinetobacter baumannii]ELB0339142.1 hypothetical protein [Acinetobacter baumannii]ELN4151250.1 hypothetical protein [Acinetobacter baumannii]
MKPEQFICEQGLDAIKDCIEEAKAYGGLYVNAKTLELSKHIPSYDAVSIIELMRLVDSLETIESWGGIESCKEIVRRATSNQEPPEKSFARKLQMDVGTYESIYGGGENA